MKFAGVLFITTTVFISINAQAPLSASEQLQQYVKELQTRQDYEIDKRALREKIIRLVAGMESAPQQSQTAVLLATKGAEGVRAAKTSSEAERASWLYQGASNDAPWIASYYAGWGDALEQAGDLVLKPGDLPSEIKKLRFFQAAKDKFELYLLAGPNTPDRTSITKRIAELDAKIQAEAPFRQLYDYIEDLKSADYTRTRALQEKIISFVAAMPIHPTLPADAETYGFKAEAMAKAARTPADFKDAAFEYHMAAIFAPWVAQYYENAAILYEKANQLEDAKGNLEVYLIAAPNAADRNDVRRKLAELDVAMSRPAADADERRTAALTDQRTNGGMRAFRHLVDGKTYSIHMCAGKKDFSLPTCTWAERSASEKRWFNALPGIKNSAGALGTGWHWAFVGDMAYLTNSDTDDIRNSQVRVHGPAATISDLTWEFHASHDYGRSYAWESGHYLSLRDDGTFIYSIDAPADPSIEPADTRHNYYWFSW